MMRLQSNTAVRDILASGTLSAVLDGAFASLYLILLFVVSPSVGRGRAAARAPRDRHDAAVLAA